jgi:hypothetical protein
MEIELNLNNCNKHLKDPVGLLQLFRSTVQQKELKKLCEPLRRGEYLEPMVFCYRDLSN